MEKSMLKELGLKRFLVLAIMTTFMSAHAVSAFAENIEWRIGSGKMGSFGYTTAATIAKVAGKHSTGINFSVLPTQGSTASMKLFGNGDIDAAYASNFQLWQAKNNEGPFSNSPLKRKLYQTLYTYTAEYPVMTLKTRDDINTWSDLRGKKVFMYTAATGAHDIYKKSLKALGLSDDVKHVEIDLMQAPDMLKSGVVDAVVGCSIAQMTANAYTENLLTRAKMKMINLKNEEAEILKKSGIVIVNYASQPVFGNDIGVDKILCPSLVFGYQAGPNLSADHVYAFVKALIEHSGELVKISEGFKGFHEGQLGFQIDAINSVPDVPLHPGLAKYLKEKGQWNDNWIVGDTK